MNELQEQVTAIYNQPEMVAYHADLAMHEGLWRSEQALIAKYCALPGRVLVIGCGAGREVFALVPQGCEVIGLDRSCAMLQQASTLERQAHGERSGRWHCGDAVCLPYRNESFESVVMLSQVIQHIPKRWRRQQALQEIRRVLKPQGYCILSSYNRPISFLYLLLMLKARQHLFHDPSKTSDLHPRQTPSMPIAQLAGWLKDRQIPGCPPRLVQLICKILMRLDWELHPLVWHFTDPLPVGIHLLFTASCAVTNAYRRLRSALKTPSEQDLEPNDFFLDFPTFDYHWRLDRGNLFVHFPDVDELRDDIQSAGLTLVEYKSLEELESGQLFSEQVRRSKRLLFYVAQKTA